MPRLVSTVGTNRANASATTIAITVSAAGAQLNNHLVAMAEFFAGDNTITFSDSKGNTWQNDRHAHHSAGATCQISSARITAALTSADAVSATFGGSVPFRGIAVYEFSGLASASWFDQGANSVSSTTASSTPASTAVTTAQASELVFGAFDLDSGGYTFTPGVGWTQLDFVDGGAGNSSIGTEYQLAAATGSFNADCALSSATNYAAAIATYKASLETTAEYMLLGAGA